MKKICIAFIIFAAADIAVGEDELITGEVKARKDVIVMSENSGLISSSLGFDKGSVKKGDRIASFSCKSIRAQISVAKKKLSLEKIKSKTKEEQFSKKAISQNEVELTRGAVEVSQAELKAKESELSKCYISAPFSGEIVELYVQRGKYVKAGDPVAHLVDVNSLYGQSYFDRSLWDSFKVGQRLLIRFRELPEESGFREAVIINKPNYIYNDQRFRVELKIEDINGLTSGMLYDVEKRVEEEIEQGRAE